MYCNCLRRHVIRLTTSNYYYEGSVAETGAFLSDVISANQEFTTPTYIAEPLDHRFF